MKLIIAGCRNKTVRPEQIREDIGAWCEDSGACLPYWPTEVLNGCATGIDRSGAEFARVNLIRVEKFPADWDKHGNMAGKIRNKEMGDCGDALLAYWDTWSPGTAHMIAYMTSLGKPVKVVCL